MRKKSRPRKLSRKVRFAFDSHGKFPIAAPGTVWNDGKVTVHFDSKTADAKSDARSILLNPRPGSLLEFLLLESALDLSLDLD